MKTKFMKLNEIIVSLFLVLSITGASAFAQNANAQNQAQQAQTNGTDAVFGQSNIGTQGSSLPDAPPPVPSPTPVQSSSSETTVSPSTATPSGYSVSPSTGSSSGNDVSPSPANSSGSGSSTANPPHKESKKD
jgi:hypothetical protein